ncbi:ferredoxin [Nocardia miyunensis]|uniref:ferredoxin n=1 Tax=Nocardia miyunensis TaxID=282684 RepID=UPI0008377CE7|nr:ferredoxin [Nocardia miyunensis]
MKVTVDSGLCAAHGDCVIAAPDIFDLGDEDEVVRILNDSPEEKYRAQIEEAVRLCPVAALKIED